jgi:hypothetical protein
MINVSNLFDTFKGIMMGPLASPKLAPALDTYDLGNEVIDHAVLLPSCVDSCCQGIATVRPG